MSSHTRKLNNCLKSVRIERELSRKKVAGFLGYRDTTLLCEWEKGTHTPKLPQVLMLAALYRTSVEALFEDLNEKVREDFQRRWEEEREKVEED